MASGELGRANLGRALDVPNSPRAAIKAGLDRGFITETDDAAVLELVADRNTCSHIYRQSLMPAILARLPLHCRAMQAVYARRAG